MTQMIKMETNCDRCGAQIRERQVTVEEFVAAQDAEKDGEAELKEAWFGIRIKGQDTINYAEVCGRCESALKALYEKAGPVKRKKRKKRAVKAKPVTKKTTPKPPTKPATAPK